MQHEAIRALYNNVISISGSGTDAVAMDKDNKIVSWDADDVAKKETELLTAFKLGELRQKRNLLIAETDHLGLVDLTMSDDMKTYRQNLRDITKTYSSLDDVKWPTKP